MLDLLVPKLVKDIQKFLGLANYYRQFVKNFAKTISWIDKKRTKIEVEDKIKEII